MITDENNFGITLAAYRFTQGHSLTFFIKFPTRISYSTDYHCASFAAENLQIYEKLTLSIESFSKKRRNPVKNTESMSLFTGLSPFEMGEAKAQAFCSIRHQS